MTTRHLPGLLALLLATIAGAQPTHSYFLQAEELAAEAQLTDDRDTLDTARTLYVLAFEQSADADPAVGPSVCLALADLARDPDEARWLRALARVIDTRASPDPDWAPTPPGLTPDRAAFDLATAIGYIRSGDGRRATPLLEQQDVSDLLDNTERLLSIGAYRGGAFRIRQHLQDWPACPQCNERGINTRVIRTPDGTRLCPTCDGNPGPELSPAELILQLRYESLLLSGVHQSWAAQTAVDGGAPLRDPNPDELAPFFNVDPALSVFDPETRTFSEPTTPTPVAPVTPD